MNSTKHSNKLKEKFKNQVFVPSQNEELLYGQKTETTSKRLNAILHIKNINYAKEKKY